MKDLRLPKIWFSVYSLPLSTMTNYKLLYNTEKYTTYVSEIRFIIIPAVILVSQLVSFLHIPSLRFCIISSSHNIVLHVPHISLLINVIISYPGVPALKTRSWNSPSTVFVAFQLPQANVCMAPYIMPKTFPSIPFTINYSFLNHTTIILFKPVRRSLSYK